jgi:hypothetical protein
MEHRAWSIGHREIQLAGNRGLKTEGRISRMFGSLNIEI